MFDAADRASVQSLDQRQAAQQHLWRSSRSARVFAGARSLRHVRAVIPFIGIAKWLGVIAILIPGFPRIKEWAYAGLMIDLIGATYSIMAIGAPVPNYAFMILPIGLGILSYIYYHKKLDTVSLNLQTA